MTGTAPDEAEGTVFRLVYRSHSLIPQNDRPVVLADIFREARTSNAQAGITGALLVTDHWFVQELEGTESVVRSLYERICEDRRHDQVTVIEAGPVEARAFSRWAMAQVSASGSADIPLEATEGEIHPTTGEPFAHLTKDQFAVLRSMRNIIGADVV
jgi:hypothetical protein